MIITIYRQIFFRELFKEQEEIHVIITIYRQIFFRELFKEQEEIHTGMFYESSMYRFCQFTY